MALTRENRDGQICQEVTAGAAGRIVPQPRRWQHLLLINGGTVKKFWKFLGKFLGDVVRSALIGVIASLVVGVIVQKIKEFANKED